MFPDLTRDDVFRLETRRLWLRWPRAADAQAIVCLAGDKAVADMPGLIPHPVPAERADAFILESRRANTEGRRLTLAITPRAQPGRLIGTVGIGWDDPAEPFLACWLGAPHRDQGFATEAARALVDAFFAYTEGRELTASVRAANSEARRVLEKCGFAAVGSGAGPFPALGGPVPLDYFRLERRMWTSLKDASLTGLLPQGRHDDPAIAVAG